MNTVPPCEVRICISAKSVPCSDAWMPVTSLRPILNSVEKLSVQLENNCSESCSSGNARLYQLDGEAMRFNDTELLVEFCTMPLPSLFW